MVLMAFALGVLAHKSGLVERLLHPLPDIRRTFTRTAALAHRPDHITIDVKYRNIQQLVAKRQQAIDTGILVTSPEDFVPATIRHGEEMIPVRLRLKGDLREHWSDDKWSFRIVTKGEHTLLGMKQFSIHRPDARNFLYEWLYHESLARQQLPAIRYGFVDVTLNGEAKGIYAIEEHFEKRLLEHNHLREGPVVRFNEDQFWLDIRDQGGLEANPGARTHSGIGSFLASPVDGFQSSRWLADTEKRAQYFDALRLLEGFRRGDLKVGETFDVKKFGMFLALSELHQAQHAVHWRNIRFYYNPVTTLLEPIGFDGTMIRDRFRGLLPTLPFVYKEARFHRHFYDALFGDEHLLREYIGALERVSQTDYVDSLLADLNDELERNLGILQRDYPDLRFSAENLYSTQQHIRAVLEPYVGVHAFLEFRAANDVELLVGNLHFLKMEVLGIQVGDQILDFKKPFVLPGRSRDSLVDYQPIPLDASMPGSEELKAPVDLTVHHRLPGSSAVLKAIVTRRESGPRLNEIPITRREANLHRFDFLEVDEEVRRIRIRSGNWVVDEDLIVPSGYRLFAYPGTTLELASSASIVSRSPLEFRGDEERPVVVRGSAENAGGIVVLDTGGSSILEHVAFEGLAEPRSLGSGLTGAVTFYQAPVAISHCRFQNARAEDALNIIRSKFEILESVFAYSASDSLDIDFGEGLIRSSRFESSVNDSMDFSGSLVSIEEILIRNAGDKAISVGENCRLTGSDIEIEGSRVGVASKDLSVVRLNGLRLFETDIGLAAYQKKPEYGPGTILADQVSIEEVPDPYWIEEQSMLRINGREIRGDRTTPRPVFYPDG